MVELYKLGSAGYVRLLFNASDLKEFGRSYRMVAAVAAIDRHRAEEYKQNLSSLRDAQRTLETRRAEMAKLQKSAAAARAAADRAAQSHAQLIAQIDSRRDLTAELAAELGVLATVGDDTRISDQALQLLVPPLDLRQPLEHASAVLHPASLSDRGAGGAGGHLRPTRRNPCP